MQVVVIYPYAGYAAAVRAALPDAPIALDHFHLIMLANKVTALRQRVTRQLLGRRGRKVDPAWANRRLLLRDRERLSERAFARMWNGCVDHDPSGQMISAWIAKEEPRALCAIAAAGGQKKPRTALGLTRLTVIVSQKIGGPHQPNGTGRGSSTPRGGGAGGWTIGTMEAPAQVVTARVTTVAPLLRRGLVRAARTAGFTVVPAHAAAQVTLRMDGHHPDARQPDCDSDVDIVVEPDSVVLTVRRSPDMSTFVRLHGLLAALLDSQAVSDR